VRTQNPTQLPRAGDAGSGGATLMSGDGVLRYKQNRFQQLRGFCYAASSGSISKAAQRMFLSQPAVSQQVRSLEEELGVPLFARRGAHIKLTHEGELLLQMAGPLVQRLEGLDQEFLVRRTEVDQGYVEVGAGSSTILYFLPKYVEAFRRAHPKIEVRLQQVTGVEGMERLRCGRLDFAVGPLMEVPGDVDFHPIVTYDPVVITPLGHPLAREKLSLEAISHYPLILPPHNLSTWPMVDRTFKRQRLAYQVAMEVGGWEAIKTYVELGLGISIIIGIGITGKERLEIMCAGELFPKRTYGLVLRKGYPLTAQARKFINVLLAFDGAPA
jgi:DNA-binding transcriptional LysR family regulator